MNSLPPFVYAKAFWEGLALAVSGLLALLVFAGKVDPSWAVPAGVISTWIFSLLRMFGINPELRAQALVQELEQRLAVLKRPTSKKK